MKRYICDGIVKGATHVRNQMPCQDNKRIVEISDKLAIIAVADGHGSSKCPRSDRGSMIAVNSFYEVMKTYLKVYGEDEAGLSNLITFLNREGDMRFAQDVCEEWQARVKQSFYKNKVDGMTDEDGNIKWPSVFSVRNDATRNAGYRQLCIFISDWRWRYQFCDKRRSRTTGGTRKIFGNRDSFIVKTGCLEKISGIGTETRNGE